MLLTDTHTYCGTSDINVLAVSTYIPEYGDLWPKNEGMHKLMHEAGNQIVNICRQKQQSYGSY